MKNKDNLVKCNSCLRELPLSSFEKKRLNEYEKICKTCKSIKLSVKAVVFRHNLYLRIDQLPKEIKIPNQEEMKTILIQVVERYKRKNDNKLRCEYCNKILKDDNFSFHNFIPISKNGNPIDTENIGICCIACLRKKHHLTKNDFEDYLKNGKLTKTDKKCKICNKILPITLFFRRSWHKYKTLDICKNCLTKINRKASLWYLRKEYETAELKLCRTCLKLLPRTPEFFSFHSRNKDRLQNQCKKCKQEQDRKYIHKKKLQNQLRHNHTILSFIGSDEK